MEILFIGVACTEDVIKESNIKYYNNNGSVRPQQYFDLNLVRGLSKYCNVKAISEPPVASYPRSKCLYYNHGDSTISDNLTIKYIRLLNLFGIKSIIIMISIFFETLRFCTRNNRKKTAILIGYMSFLTSFPALLIGKIFRVKVFVMVPDIPKYANKYSNSNSIRNKMINTLTKFNRATEGKFDGYILLTKYMNNLVNADNKPYIVMEGFINSEDISIIGDIPKELKKIIMYAGTLHEKFGIKKLIDAFNLIKIDDCELWIYGEGDYLSKIQEICVRNNNIKYKGNKNRDEIIKLERRVTLLVNPRPSNEEFTKYSFPSKTTEYMASSTPLLTTKLPGIPEEYYEYVYMFESEDVVEMSRKIEQILCLPNDILDNFGLRAKEFIIKNKNHLVQTETIYEFINKNN